MVGELEQGLVKTPRLLLCNSGLMSHLSGLNRNRLAEVPNLLGPLLENFVVMELQKQASWSRTQPRLFHFLTQTGQEVDIVLEDPAGHLVGIEVKDGATVTAQDFKGLRALAELTSRRFHRGLVLYTGSESVPFAPRLHALPVSSLWTMGARKG